MFQCFVAHTIFPPPRTSMPLTIDSCLFYTPKNHNAMQFMGFLLLFFQPFPSFSSAYFSVRLVFLQDPVSGDASTDSAAGAGRKSAVSDTALIQWPITKLNRFGMTQDRILALDMGQAMLRILDTSRKCVLRPCDCLCLTSIGCE